MDLLGSQAKVREKEEKEEEFVAAIMIIATMQQAHGNKEKQAEVAGRH